MYENDNNKNDICRRDAARMIMSGFADCMLGFGRNFPPGSPTDQKNQGIQT